MYPLEVPLVIDKDFIIFGLLPEYRKKNVSFRPMDPERSIVTFLELHPTSEGPLVTIVGKVGVQVVEGEAVVKLITAPGVAVGAVVVATRDDEGIIKEEEAIILDMVGMLEVVGVGEDVELLIMDEIIKLLVKEAMEILVAVAIGLLITDETIELLSTDDDTTKLLSILEMVLLSKVDTKELLSISETREVLSISEILLDISDIVELSISEEESEEGSEVTT